MADLLPPGASGARVGRRAAAVPRQRTGEARDVGLLRSRVIVARPRDHVFDVFARRTDGWWPVASQCAVPDRVREVRLDPWVGGQLAEVWSDGSEHPWATVLGWRPPFEVTLAWRVRLGAELTDVTIRFAEASWVTSWVTVLHTGWADLGDDGPELRAEYRERWADVLGAFLWSV